MGSGSSGKMLLLGVVSLLAAGCSSATGPWPMPTGYAYHNEEYKAPPGPEPEPVFKQWESRRKGGTAPVVLSTTFENPSETVSDAPAAAEPVTADAIPMAPDTVPVTPVTSESLRAAADELTAQLFKQFGRPAEAVYIDANAATDPGFDKALRESLQAQGVPVATAPGMGPFTLTVSSMELAGDTAGRRVMTLAVTSAGKKVAEATGLYAVSGGTP